MKKGSGSAGQRVSGFLVILFIFTLCAARYTLCAAQSISSTELINNAKTYDDKIVSYSGEVIGDIMQRQVFSWININDGENALGIWINSSLTKDIIHTGSYKSRGDEVEVSGIFHRSCPEHGGDLDIHAINIRKINNGRNISERLNQNKKNFVFTLALILGIVWILTLLKRK